MKKKETRTIEWVYGLDPEKSTRLVTEVCNGTMRTSSCVYHWMHRKRTPCYLEMLFIQKVVKKIYGLEIPLAELFARKCRTGE